MKNLTTILICCFSLSVSLPLAAQDSDVGTRKWLEKPVTYPFTVGLFVKGAYQIKPPRGLAVINTVFGEPKDGSVRKNDVIAEVADEKKNLKLNDLEELLSKNAAADKRIDLVVFRMVRDGARIKWVKEKVSAHAMNNQDILELYVEKKTDNLTRDILWRHIDAPKVGETGFHVIFNASNEKDEPKAYFQALYHGDDYFGFEKLTIKAGERLYEFERNIFERKTDISGAGVSEWFTLPLDEKNISLIHDLAIEKKIQIRWTGNNFFKDGEFTENDRQLFQMMYGVQQCFKHKSWK